MFSKKRNQHFDKRNQEMIQLGMENKKIIAHAHQWCKHLKIKMVSYGMLAEMTGLPIGSHSIVCSNVNGGSETMNLPLFLPDLIIKSCIGCSYHSPNGCQSWGNEIIETWKKSEDKKEEEDKVLKENLTQLRAIIRELPRNAKKDAEIDEQQILLFVEGLFSDSREKQKESAKLLAQSAKIGADLFPPIAIDIIFEQSLTGEFGQYCLPVIIELAVHRSDLKQRTFDTCLVVIEKTHYTELGAQILLQLDDSVTYPLKDECISKLITSQHYYRHPLFDNAQPPEYPASIEVILHCYDALSNSVIKQLQRLLLMDDQHTRINICGVIMILQTKRPNLVYEIFSDLLVSFKLPDDPYDTSADVKAIKILTAALINNPELTDQKLMSIFPKSNSITKEAIVGIYREYLSNITNRFRKGKITINLTVTKVAIQRCIEFIQNGSLDLDVRTEAANVLSWACAEYPELVSNYVDALLGYYALLCSQDAPIPPPQILLPGKKENVSEENFLSSLDKFNKQQQWRHFKDTVLKCFKELIEHMPQPLGETVIKCYLNTYLKTDEQLKVSLLSLLGELGWHYSYQPVVLPIMMTALMNFESQSLRASAIHSIERMYSHSTTTPPQNIVDALVIHLRDSYVIVHTSAIRLLRWNSSWLNQNQALEALGILIAWLEIYKNQPYQLKDIFETILNVGFRYKPLNNLAITSICKYLPTKEQLVDETIADEMTYYIEPNHVCSKIAASKLIWFLGNYDRDRYQEHEQSHRSSMIKWLNKLPDQIYDDIEPTLLESGKKIAERDAWEACYIADLYSQRQKFKEEATILEIAATSLGDERRNHNFKQKLLQLRNLAIMNAALKAGETAAAYKLVSKIKVVDNDY